MLNGELRIVMKIIAPTPNVSFFVSVIKSYIFISITIFQTSKGHLRIVKHEWIKR